MEGMEKILNQPESKTLEFKRDLSSLDPILKTIIAFANTAGGILIIGRDANGNLLGVKDVLKAEEALANSISDNIRPSLLPEIEISTVEGKDFLVVKVAHWKGPFYLNREGKEKGVYIRLGSTTRPITHDLLEDLQRSILNISYDQQALPDLSKEALQVEIAYQLMKTLKKEVDEEKLRSLGVLVSYGGREVPSIGGVILFGKKEIRNQLLPDARVSCARFLGNDKSNILDRHEVEGTILDAVNEVPKFIARNTRLSSEIKGMRRKDIPEYHPIAIREGLINALVHADYSVLGSHIQIAIFDNRLEIQNPGMLPFGFTLEDLKSGVSRTRNRVITRVFHELKLMEEWGSGYKRIIESCRSENYPEPKWEELGRAVRVTFFPHRASQLEPLLERERAILSLFKKGEKLPFREIYERLALKISERMLRYDLVQLKKKGYLTTVGEGRGTLWQRL